MATTRRLRALLLLLATLTTGLGAHVASAQTPPPATPSRVINIVQIEGGIDAAYADYIVDEIRGSERRQDALVVLRLSSSAAVKVDSRRLLAAVLGATVPVVTYVGPNDATVAGLPARLWSAGDVRFVAPGATIRSHEAGHRVLHRGAEAVTAGAAQGLASSIFDVIRQLDGKTAEVSGSTVTLHVDPKGTDIDVRFANPGLLRRIRQAVSTNPTLVYLLLLAGAFSIVFELFQPGFGPAGYAGIILLAFAAVGLVGLPIAPWALALVLAGLLALTWDVASGGLGVPTWAGTAVLAVGSVFLVHSDGQRLRVPWPTVAVGVLSSVVFFVVVMTVVIRSLRGPAPELGRALLGRVGEVRSTLNPQGHVLVEGALWRARGSDGDRVEAGTRVTVTGFDETALVLDVEPVSEGS